MPEAIIVNCTILEKTWLTPMVMKIRFEPSRRFTYKAGQFLSLIIPPPPNLNKPKRRIYSFASPCDGPGPYELSVRFTGGPGTSYWASLKVGDVFRATAPYGDFLYEPKAGGQVCFISTGTGVAPFKAMAESKEFQGNRPEKAISLFGCRTAEDIIYPGHFESLGLEVINAISDPTPRCNPEFNGRVTDWLRGLPPEWPWHTTDFFICGNGEMITEVYSILRGRGVPEMHIHKEVYFATQSTSIQPPIKMVA